ncbi:MAG: type VI secretion system baseplate subunit TssK [Thermoguttaceae bacterium]
MHNLPVHWHEGLFLQPHHLQAADRYWTELVQTCEQWDHHYNYGLRGFQFSHEAIGNYQFQVNACQARMKDGTLISLEPGQEPDRVDLKEAFAQESKVRVFLAVPKLRLGKANVGTRPAGQERYVETRRPVQDETTGGNEQELALRDLNVRVMLSTQDLGGYEVLPVAQVERVGEREAAPQLDTSYIPPLLAVDAWPPLGRDTVRAIYDMIGKKIEVLSEQVVNRGITLVSQEPGDLDRLLMLAQLNGAYATLHVLTFASGIHPLAAYTELVRIVGQLSIFSPQRRPPDIPAYDHDDLARIFSWVKQQIELLLQSIRDYEYEQRFFVGEGHGMRVSLESRWLGPDWQWYVGVLRGSLTPEQCIALLSPGALNWKLGSSRQVEALFKYGQIGLQLTPLAQAPRALPPSKDWVYYQVSRGNAAWKDVLETQTLAMRLQEKLIVNLDTLQGDRKLIVSHGGKQYPLQFALFAVPSRQ